MFGAAAVVAAVAASTADWINGQQDSTCVQASYDFAADAQGNASKQGAVQDWYTDLGSRHDAPQDGWQSTVHNGATSMRNGDWTLVLYHSQDKTWLVAKVECSD